MRNAHELGLYKDHIELVKFGEAEDPELKSVIQYLKWISSTQAFDMVNGKWANWELEQRKVASNLH